MSKRVKRAIAVWVASLAVLGLLGGTALAQPAMTDAGLLVEKLDASTTLVLDEGERLRLRSDTVIVKDGAKISFSDIPTAEQALPGVIMVHWSALNPDGTAAHVLIRHLLN